MRLKLLAGSAALCAVLASCSTGGVSDLTPTTAVLHGSILTSDAPASFVFQYAKTEGALGTGTGYTTARKTIPAGPGETPVSTTVTGLTANTAYVYRLCVRVKAATVDKCLDVREFSTPSAGQLKQVFNQPGTSTVTVPAGVTQVAFDAAGAAGGAGLGGSPESLPDGTSIFLPKIPGGKGAAVRQVIGVKPGDRLVVRVASAGGDAPAQLLAGRGTGAGGKGGTNGADRGGDGGEGVGSSPVPTDGGGAGGGAPTRIDRISGGTTETILVAGGGGGAGGEGLTGIDDDVATRGGAAGPTGETGVAGIANGGGGGGGFTSPGTGGTPGGAPGAGFDGGKGGSDTTTTEPEQYGARWGRGGGGGGGGWHGAGGGGSGWFQANLFYNVYSSQVSSGGGGGSSYAKPNPFGELPAITAGSRDGDGIATLTMTPGI